MRLAVASVGVLAMVALSFGACGGGDDDDDDAQTTTSSTTGTSSTTTGTSSTSSTSSTGTGGGPAGPCDESIAAQPCAPNCTFEPAIIDCATACTNVASICASGCTDQCTGLNQDVALCTAGCEGTKSLYCTNLVYGCYAANTTCDTVGSCISEQM